MDLYKNLWMNDVLNVKIDTSMLRHGGDRPVSPRQYKEFVVT